MAGNELGDWLGYMTLFAQAYAGGRELSRTALSGPPPPLLPGAGAGVAGAGGGVVLCSPHPDDELLTGALPYRLLRQAGTPVANLVLTLGSDRARREERLLEVAAACQAIGFAWQLAALPLAFDRLSPEARRRHPTAWEEKVAILAAHFDRLQPAVVLCPHGGDGHPTHRGVHLLVLEALLRHSRQRATAITLVESEFWQPMGAPNLLLGISPADGAQLLAALTWHRGELRRNPYHLRQPARWMDNVRRGGELLGGYGGGGADFVFAELYRLSRFVHGRQQPWRGGALVVGPDQRLELGMLREE